MKVGKLLLPNAGYHPGKRAKIWINPDARPDETNPLNPYLLYEVPRNRSFSVLASTVKYPRKDAAFLGLRGTERVVRIRVKERVNRCRHRVTTA